MGYRNDWQETSNVIAEWVRSWILDPIPKVANARTRQYPVLPSCKIPLMAESNKRNWEGGWVGC